MASEEYVGKISDAQCLELALLAYQDLDEGIYENQTLEKYVNSYSPADLKTLLNSENQKKQDLGKMIQSLQLEMEKEDSPMKNLEIREYDQANGYLVFVDQRQPDHAYLVFRGTRYCDEWIDNCKGLYMTDTPMQENALEFASGLETYATITTIGHSKGENLAMYVSLLLDKVDRNVGINGQGFNNEFQEKYASEISLNAGKITNYANALDYVNILMTQPEGINQPFFEEENGEHRSFASHDIPAAFRYDDDYTISLQNCDGVVRTPFMEYAHGFTEYAMDYLPPDAKKHVASFLGNLTAVGLGKDNKNKDGEELGALGSENTVGLILTAVCLQDYIQKTEQDDIPQNKALKTLVSAMNVLHTVKQLIMPITSITDDFEISLLKKYPDEIQLIFTVIGRIRSFILPTELTTSTILKEIKGFLNDDKKRGKEENEFKRLNLLAQDVANRFSIVLKTYNYSHNAYSSIMSAIDRVQNLSGDIDNCTSRISAYSGHEWYSGVGAEKLTSCLEAFSDTLIEIGASSRSQINSTYEAVMAVDRGQSAEVKGVTDRIKARTAAISLS